MNMRLLNITLKAALASVMLASFAAPAFAGPKEVDYLHSLAGTWNGQGKITGAEAGSVACRLTLRPSGERLNFNGRCTYSGSSTPQSFSGRISFNDRTGNWEASSRGDIVAGKKNGSTLTFVMSGTDMRGTGHSTLSLSPRQIKVDMQITRNGETSKGSIPFTKA